MNTLLLWFENDDHEHFPIFNHISPLGLTMTVLFRLPNMTILDGIMAGFKRKIAKCYLDVRTCVIHILYVTIGNRFIYTMHNWYHWQCIANKNHNSSISVNKVQYQHRSSVMPASQWNFHQQLKMSRNIKSTSYLYFIERRQN